MFGLGTGEMLLILVVALLVLPPEQLPKAMRQLGRWYAQLRRTADDLRRAFVLEADRQDAAARYRELQERRKKAQDARKKSEAEVGGAAQPEPVAAAAPDAPAVEGPVPNDLPPDAPAAGGGPTP